MEKISFRHNKANCNTGTADLHLASPWLVFWQIVEYPKYLESPPRIGLDLRDNDF